VSRGPGKIENAVEASMRRLVRPTASQLAAAVYEVPEERLTPSQLGSVRRALRRLAERGIVKGETPPTSIIWTLVGVTPGCRRARGRHHQGRNQV
jgi:hypothetical protein